MWLNVDVRLRCFALMLLSLPAAAESVVHIYNWNDYFAEDTLSGFRERTGMDRRGASIESALEISNEKDGHSESRACGDDAHA